MRSGEWCLRYTAYNPTESPGNDLETITIILEANTKKAAIEEARSKWKDIVFRENTKWEKQRNTNHRPPNRPFYQAEPRPYITYLHELEVDTLIVPGRNEQRWINLWSRIGAKGDAKESYDKLANMYRQDNRRSGYHNFQHIENCLQELEDVGKKMVVLNYDAIEIALWYQDAVYDIHANDNEEKSADLVLEMMKEAELEDLGELAGILILATKHSIESPLDTSSKIITDIDLAILGKPYSEFSEYEHKIRSEYKSVPSKIFIEKRLDILQSFANRKHIYSSDFFRKKYEAQARVNIHKSIAALRSKKV